ncbi:MAG: ABC transporter ATP-binding protein [Hyphomicrobiales bacterium]|nr:ABC transporter ATP-binding protein [Hyphomicrobiales bacterium]MCP5373682.1 ABC transporter ATP-binding protein [Hyphomicrobiales bacterium]
MLELDRVVSGYGDGVALHGASLRVAEGEVLGLLGRNGVGKTTLLKTVMGLLRARAGTIRFAGRPIAGLRPFEIARLGVGYVPQGREIFADFTVLENLRLGNLDSDDFSVAFDAFPVLQQRRDSLAGSFSGGQQQQLAIARALMGNPRLLLLDEPSEGIQPSIVAEIADVLRRTAAEQGVAMVLVEQNVDMALALCQRCAFIEGGVIAEEHPVEALRADPAILDRYLAF